MLKDNTQESAVRGMLRKGLKMVCEGHTTRLFVPSFNNEPSEVYVIEQAHQTFDFVENTNIFDWWAKTSPTLEPMQEGIDWSILSKKPATSKLNTVYKGAVKMNIITTGSENGAYSIFTIQNNKYCIQQSKVTILDDGYETTTHRDFGLTFSESLFIDYGINRIHVGNLSIETLLRGTPLQKKVLGYIDIVRYIQSYL